VIPLAAAITPQLPKALNFQEAARPAVSFAICLLPIAVGIRFALAAFSAKKEGRIAKRPFILPI